MRITLTPPRSTYGALGLITDSLNFNAPGGVNTPLTWDSGNDTYNNGFTFDGTSYFTPAAPANGRYLVIIRPYIGPNPNVAPVYFTVSYYNNVTMYLAASQEGYVSDIFTVIAPAHSELVGYVTHNGDSNIGGYLSLEVVFLGEIA